MIVGYITGPKLRFPTCPAYQNMTFPHISYTYLAEDRAEFYAKNEMHRKSCPILQISYMIVQNPNFRPVIYIDRSAMQLYLLVKFVTMIFESWYIDLWNSI